MLRSSLYNPLVGAVASSGSGRHCAVGRRGCGWVGAWRGARVRPWARATTQAQVVVMPALFLLFFVLLRPSLPLSLSILIRIPPTRYNPYPYPLYRASRPLPTTPTPNTRNSTRIYSVLRELYLYTRPIRRIRGEQPERQNQSQSRVMVI